MFLSAARATFSLRIAGQRSAISWPITTLACRIAVTVVAAGISTPELATSLVAVIRGRHGISAGNLIGSDLFNLLGVLGLASWLRPMTIDANGYGSMVLLLCLVTLVVIMMRTGWRISRFEGAALVLINLGRWVADFARTTPIEP